MATSNYRMIAIDLDGTLLCPSGRVSDRTRQAVHRLLSAGILVCFATGRNFTESRTVIDAIDHWPTAVFAGGAIVIDTQRRLTIHRTLIRPDLACEVSHMLEDNGHAVLALQDTDAAGVDYLITDAVPLNAATTKWLAATRSAVLHVPSLGRYDHRHTIRLGIVAAPDEVVAARRELHEQFTGRIFFQCLHLPAHGVEVVEIFDPAVNKWQGILRIARRHGIEPRQIVAIGDDVNDLPMIENAGLGVAMGNAKPEVQAVADCVIGHNGEEGLADFLDELLAEHLVEPEPAGTIDQRTE